MCICIHFTASVTLIPSKKAILFLPFDWTNYNAITPSNVSVCVWLYGCGCGYGNKIYTEIFIDCRTENETAKKKKSGANQINIPHKINSGAYQTAPPQNWVRANRKQIACAKGVAGGAILFSVERWSDCTAEEKTKCWKSNKSNARK